MKTFKETDHLSELRAGDQLEMNDGSVHKAMTDETKKLIDELETFSTVINGRKEYFSGWVRKSDLIRVVEELTKWNKVEDGKPEFISTNSHMSKQVLCKMKEGYFKVCQFSYILGFYPLYANEDVTEWKYIN